MVRVRSANNRMRSAYTRALLIEAPGYSEWPPLIIEGDPNRQKLKRGKPNFTVLRNPRC